MAFARNSNEIAWEGASGASIGDDATYVGVWDALTNGNFLFAVTVSNNPDALALGEVYYIAASGLAIQQTAGTREAEESAQEALRGKLGGVGTVTRYYAVHVGDPGTNGANEGDLARVALAHTAFTYSNT